MHGEQPPSEEELRATQQFQDKAKAEQDKPTIGEREDESNKPRRPEASQLKKEVAQPEAPETRPSIEGELARIDKAQGGLDTTSASAETRPVSQPLNPKRKLHRTGLNVFQGQRVRNAFAHAENILGPQASDQEVELLGNAIAAEHVPAILRSIRNQLPRGAERIREQMIIDEGELNAFKQLVAQERRVMIVTPHVNNMGDAFRVISSLLPPGGRATIMWEGDPFGKFLKATNGFQNRQGPLRFDCVASKRPQALEYVTAKLKAMGQDRPEVLALDGLRGDLVPKDQRAFVKFLHGEAQFPTRPAQLAESSGVTVVPISIGEVNGRLKLSFGEPLRFPPAANEKERQAAQRDFTQAIANHFAKGVAESPYKLDVNRGDFWKKTER